MMRAPDFRYHAARSVKDAARALRDGGENAMLIAGGTDLVPNMKRRQQTPALLIGIRHLRDLRRIGRGDAPAIGSAVRLAEVAADRVLQRRYPALARAAGAVATPQIRNMGTLGGNLCLDTRCTYYNQSHEWRQAINFCMKAPGATGGHACSSPTGDAICWVATSSPRCWAVSSTDTAPALIALGARVTLVSAEGEREIALSELYANDGMAYLTRRPDEILTAVRLAPAEPGWRSTYWKLRRRGSFDFPVLSVAAAVRFGSAGEVAEARVVLGAVASRPVLVPESAALVGGRLSDDAIEGVAAAAAGHATPLDNTDLAYAWRKKMVRRYVGGALRELGAEAS
ncbi:MAG TPA: FAD binding domain-containing protein [Gemmatimonadales bacterium]|nr:FAD binding domain-containing protein [Gemmatimonadales bacterium]